MTVLSPPLKTLTDCIAFHKLCSCGNDFIAIDCRENAYLDKISVPSLCNRHFGIGADGVIALVQSPCADFGMRIWNADGSEADMCGNGLRCLALFIKYLGEKKQNFSIETGAGIYPVSIADHLVSSTMPKPKNISTVIVDQHTFFLIDTGVPHALTLKPLQSPFQDWAPSLRTYKGFGAQGANINWLNPIHSPFFLRTFERGVPDETLACGTAAAAAAFLLHKKTKSDTICIKPKSGHLIHHTFSCEKITQTGSVTHVFSGTLPTTL